MRRSGLPLRCDGIAGLNPEARRFASARVPRQIARGSVPGKCALACGVLSKQRTEADIMLYTLIVVLLVLWALGLATSYTLGGVLHLLLIAAVVLLAVQLITGRRTV